MIARTNWHAAMMSAPKAMLPRWYLATRPAERMIGIRVFCCSSLR